MRTGWILSRGVSVALPSIIVLLATASSTWAITTISSYPSGGGISTFADAGEVFTVPVNGDSYFASFSFLTGGNSPPAQTTFYSELYPFDVGSFMVSGPAVYTSETRQAEALFPYRSITFTPASPIPLNPGDTYIFTFRQRGFGNSGNLQWELSSNYTGGRFLTTLTRPPYDGVVWTVVTIEPVNDIGFSATFVPEPSTGMTAFASLILLARRRPRGA